MANMTLTTYKVVSISGRVGFEGLDVDIDPDVAAFAKQLTASGVGEFVAALGADAVLSHIDPEDAVDYYDLELAE